MQALSAHQLFVHRSIMLWHHGTRCRPRVSPAYPHTPPYVRTYRYVIRQTLLLPSEEGKKRFFLLSWRDFPRRISCLCRLSFSFHLPLLSAFDVLLVTRLPIASPAPDASGRSGGAIGRNSTRARSMLLRHFLSSDFSFKKRSPMCVLALVPCSFL